MLGVWGLAARAWGVEFKSFWVAVGASGFPPPVSGNRVYFGVLSRRKSQKNDSSYDAR